MRRWFGPLLMLLIVGFAAHQLTLVAAPRVLMAAALRRVGQAGPNRFFHAPPATDRSRAVVRPSPDLAYSSCPLDLSAGPVAIHVAPPPSPYWSLSVFDSNTDAVFVRNMDEAGGKPVNIVLARRGQPVPPGREVVRVHGAKGIALLRILVENRAAFPAIDAVRGRSTCRLL